MHTPEQIEILQAHYVSCRRLIESGLVPDTFAQKALEEPLGGMLGKLAWRPTHISPNAAHAAISGTDKLQRAHGVIPGRLDRYERTMKILRGPMQEFQAWWSFFVENDKTVILTRSEHASGKSYEVTQLIELPGVDADMFTSSGYNFKLRKKKEILWLEAQIKNYMSP